MSDELKPEDASRLREIADWLRGDSTDATSSPNSRGMSLFLHGLANRIDAACSSDERAEFDKALRRLERMRTHARPDYAALKEARANVLALFDAVWNRRSPTGGQAIVTVKEAGKFDTEIALRPGDALEITVGPHQDVDWTVKEGGK